MIDATAIKSSRTNGDGKYQFTEVPAGDYVVYASMSSSSFYIEWLVPINLGNSDADLDLFNDNATMIQNYKP